MARYYRRRYRTIVRAPKKKWGSNMVELNMTVSNTSSSSTGPITGFDQSVLAQNKSEATSPTPIIVKTGNFKIQGDCNFKNTGTDTTTFTTAILYIIFIPEGFVPILPTDAQNLLNNHPEWILAWRYLEAGTLNPNRWTDSNRFTFSSRLKRNLNSGDRIYAFLLSKDLPLGATLEVKGQCQFWSCAN